MWANTVGERNTAGQERCPSRGIPRGTRCEPQGAGLTGSAALQLQPVQASQKCGALWCWSYGTFSKEDKDSDFMPNLPRINICPNWGWNEAHGVPFAPSGLECHCFHTKLNMKLVVLWCSSQAVGPKNKNSCRYIFYYLYVYCYIYLFLFFPFFWGGVRLQWLAPKYTWWKRNCPRICGDRTEI